MTELSNDEKPDGAEVVAEEENLKTCPECGGNGEVECDECGGTGEGETCDACDGEGIDDDGETCIECDGDGTYECDGMDCGEAGGGRIICTRCDGKGEISE